MMHLRALQQDLQAYLFEPGTAPVPGGIVGAGRDDQRRRLDIYADAYRLRLMDVLRGDYPAVAAVLGPAAFEGLSLDYIRHYPSESASLRWFGRHVDEAIRSGDHPHRIALAELARFEWLQAEVFDAPDDTRLAAADLERVPAADWPGLVFRLHAAVRCLRLSHGAPQAWSAAMADHPTVPRSEPGDWLLWRADLDVHWRSLEPDEAWAIRGLFKGIAFEQLCTGLSDWHGTADAPAAAVAFLQRWLADGLLAECRY